MTREKSKTIFSKQAMQDRCEGKNSCEVEASNGVFGDPCVGTRKYLTATWECASSIISGNNLPEDDLSNDDKVLICTYRVL